MLRVAIIGAGTMGRVHGNALKNVRGAELVALCDADEARARESAARLGTRAYGSLEAALAAEDVDIVDVCLPTYLHKDAALAAIGAGKHVFCEKPIALSAGDGRAMAAAAEAKGLAFSVGQVLRYFPAYANAARAIAEKRIGTPKLIRTTRTGAYPSSGWQDWYGDAAKSGGIMTDLVIHDFDWIRHVFGEVERVYARSLGARGIKGMDHCLVTLRLANGAIAHVEGSWAYPKGSIFGSTFEVIGTAGQLEFDSRASSPIRKDIGREGFSGYSLESPVFPEQEPYGAELQAFVDSVAAGTPPPVSGEDAARALEIAAAAVESARSGESVDLGGRGKERGRR